MRIHPLFPSITIPSRFLDLFSEKADTLGRTRGDKHLSITKLGVSSVNIGMAISRQLGSFTEGITPYCSRPFTTDIFIGSACPDGKSILEKVGHN